MGRQLPPRLIKPRDTPYPATVRDRGDWRTRHGITIIETVGPIAPRGHPPQEELAARPATPGATEQTRLQSNVYGEPRGWDYMPSARPVRLFTVQTPTGPQFFTAQRLPTAAAPSSRAESRMTSRGRTVEQRMANGAEPAPIPGPSNSAGRSDVPPRLTREGEQPRRGTSPEILYAPEDTILRTAFRRATATPQAITAPPPRVNVPRNMNTAAGSDGPAVRATPAPATAATQRRVDFLDQVAEHIRTVRAEDAEDDDYEDSDTESDTATEVDFVPPEVADPHAAYVALTRTDGPVVLSEEDFNALLRIISRRYTLQEARDVADRHSLRHITQFPIHTARYVANAFLALLNGGQRIVTPTLSFLREVEDHIPRCTGRDCDVCHMYTFTVWNR
ncbi:uncharacterized protein LOC62_01G001515 [Vanrija pseudolonga]|uniref:Uncharacterized protein n=1 Tax=Vanrija pseudolonga TaxID=143232 RepID=A0AAF0Y151_9TREE|nr:hypothetical protein LOC62_01G001515 [Vanrija pseudolonga]